MAFYVTTPIYYVNAAPHLGHAYTTIGADILARHMRQRGEEVFFLTGTDEHGEPVAQAAEREGVTPKELADRNAARFKALMPRINASNDFFIRTSRPAPQASASRRSCSASTTTATSTRASYEGWYCPRCADFKTENEIARGQHLPDPQDPARPRAGGELVLPALRLPGAARAALRRAARTSCAPRHALQRGARRSSPAASTTSRLSRAKLTWGVDGPVGPGPRLLRLVRRAAELLHGARASPATART